MAKRKHKKSTRRRRRGVGAFGLKGKDNMLKLASLGAGFFIGKPINDQIDKLLAKVNPTTATATTSSNGTIATVAELGLGGILLMRKKSAGTMGMSLTVAGGLLAGAGLRRAIGQLGFMNGYQSVPVIGRHRMAGYQSVPVIGQRNMPAQLSGNGMPPQLSGFRVNGYTPTGSGVMGKIGAVDGGSGITATGGGGLMG